MGVWARKERRETASSEKSDRIRMAPESQKGETGRGKGNLSQRSDAFIPLPSPPDLPPPPLLEHARASLVHRIHLQLAVSGLFSVVFLRSERVWGSPHDRSRSPIVERQRNASLHMIRNFTHMPRELTPASVAHHSYSISIHTCALTPSISGNTR